MTAITAAPATIPAPRGFIPRVDELADLLDDPYLAEAVRLLEQEPIGHLEPWEV